MKQFSELSNGGNYFSFIILGYAFSDIFVTVTMSPSLAINQERILGTFESMLLSPFNLSFIITCETIIGIVKSIVRVAIIIVIGIMLGADPGNFQQFIQASLSIAIAIAIFFSLAMIIAGFTLLDRRFQHLSTLYISISTVFSGAFFPTSQLPDVLRNVFIYLPFPYCMNLLRNITNGKTTIIASITIPIVICFFSIAISIYFFRKLEKFARKKSLILRY